MAVHTNNSRNANSCPQHLVPVSASVVPCFQRAPTAALHKQPSCLTCSAVLRGVCSLPPVLQAMARDLKLNRMQHTAAALRCLCERFIAHEVQAQR